MSDGKYWELFGKVRAAVHDIAVRRDQAKDAILKFAKRNGAQGYAVSEGFAPQFYMHFKKAPDAKLWKRLRGQDFYLPKVSTTEGKQIRRELDGLQKACPGAGDVHDAVGFTAWVHGTRWYTLGYGIFGNRVIISAPEHYKPSAKLSKDIRRISDVEVDDLEAEKRKLTAKKKQKTVKR